MKLVEALKGLEGLNISRRIDRVRLDKALHSLRQIFFYPSELITTLEEISQGDPADEELVEYFAREFHTVPMQIDDALEYLDNERFEDRNTLRIQDLALMRDIRNGKLSTRQDVSRFFRNYSDATRAEKREFATEAARVLGQIQRLNSAIESLEARLLAFRGSRAAEFPAQDGENSRRQDRRPPRRRAAARSN